MNIPHTKKIIPRLRKPRDSHFVPIILLNTSSCSRPISGAFAASVLSCMSAARGRRAEHTGHYLKGVHSLSGGVMKAKCQCRPVRTEGGAGPRTSAELYLAIARPVSRQVADIGRVGNHVGAVDVIDGLAFRKSSQVSVVENLISQLRLQGDKEQSRHGETHVQRAGTWQQWGDTSLSVAQLPATVKWDQGVKATGAGALMVTRA